MKFRVILYLKSCHKVGISVPVTIKFYAMGKGKQNQGEKS
jgi:hypothetical protein